MPRTYEDASGRLHRHPLTREAALADKSADYFQTVPPVICRDCWQETKWHKHSGTCAACVTRDAFNAFNVFTRTKLFIDFKRAGVERPVVFPRLYLGGPFDNKLLLDHAGDDPEAVGIELSEASVLRMARAAKWLFGDAWRNQVLNGGQCSSSREEAAARKTTYYIDRKPCHKCGDIAVRYTATGACRSCEELKTPRQVAIAEGETLYTPDVPCTRCGKRAPKRVDNGRCSGCTSSVDSSAKPKTDRQLAYAAGLSWYAPAELCPSCGLSGLKHMVKGGCRGCNPLKSDALNDETRALMTAQPELQLSRIAALICGLQVYRDSDEFKETATGRRVEE